MVKYYIVGALLAGVVMFYVPFWPAQLLLGWIMFSLGSVSFAYLFNYPELFRKREDGSIPFYVRWLFIPFLLGTGAYNSWARKNDQVPPIQKIDDGLFLACRLFGKDMDDLKARGVNAILDVTAEFDGLDWSAYQADLDYLNIPVLDHTSPTPEQLNTAINWIEQKISSGGKVVVHCALGRGRSVLTVAAYLLAKDDTLSIMDAMGKIQSVRTTARLNKNQLKSLSKIKQGGRLQFTRSLALIANPVSGGGKWVHEKEAILASLNPHFRVSVYETTKDISASHLAEKAQREGNKILIACGGDGTITEVAATCIKSGSTLGAIPLGTANALSQVLHGSVSKLMPIQTACDVIVEGNTLKMDTALCNNKVMLMVSAVGFEEEMIASADRDNKNEGGQFAYLKGLWTALSNNGAKQLTVKFDDGEEQLITTPSFVIANAAPVTTALAQGGDEPDVTDGKLDVTWLTPQEENDSQFLSLAELVFTDKQTKSQSARIQHAQVEKVTVTQREIFQYAIDGEIASDDKLVVEIQPSSLTVLSSKELTKTKET